jgi:hypothetical protein
MLKLPAGQRDLQFAQTFPVVICYNAFAGVQAVFWYVFADVRRRFTGVGMIDRKLLKTEIDKVKSEHLELLYGIIKLLEDGRQRPEVGAGPDWHEFVANTYGCLAEAPISRGDQGHFESREAME